ncbi:MAG: hypothetical protein PGN25_21490 [Methylorubrum populi]
MIHEQSSKLPCDEDTSAGQTGSHAESANAESGVLLMTWAQRQVTRDEIRSVELLFREQAASFDRDKRMLLVRVDEAWDGTWPAVRLRVPIC